MSLTKPIPKQLREEMSQDKFYSKCCIADETCNGKIDWHHNLRSYINGNKGRVNEKFCILPVCKSHHNKADTTEVKEKLDWVMWNRASEQQIIYYSKAISYQQIKQYLNTKYGTYNPR